MKARMLIFKNEPNAWHGFHAFEGPRRVIQLNWVTDKGVVWREQTRHRVSAFFKRLRGEARAGADVSYVQWTCERSIAPAYEWRGAVSDGPAGSNASM